jgi:hypothetical protein
VAVAEPGEDEAGQPDEAGLPGSPGEAGSQESREDED